MTEADDRNRHWDGNAWLVWNGETWQPETPTADVQPGRTRWIILGIVFLLVLAVGVSVVFYHASHRMDAHAQVACDEVNRAHASQAGRVDVVLLEVSAIGDAADSSDADLHPAPTATTVASTFPIGSPLYENPGHYEFARVSEWCAAHG